MDGDGGGSSGNEQNTSVNSKRKGKSVSHRHTPQQIQRLEAFFKEYPHPDESQRKKLCKELNLEADQVKFWFQNKRTQSKAQEERSSNILLRGENEKIKCENEAMLEALKNVICPPCGGPSFGTEERERNLQKLRLENVQLKAKRDQLFDIISKNNPNRPTMVGSSSSVHRQQIYDTRISNGTNPSNLSATPSSLESPASQTIQPQPLSQMDIMQLSETAASAVEELKRLFFTNEPLWVKSSIDGTYVIDQDHYENFSHAIRHFRTSSARIESSRDDTVVPIEATSLIEMFLDSEKWEGLFPTIVNKAKTIHSIGLELPIKENCNVLQVIWERLHILSPLVPPREFRILRCCQQIDEGLWIIAEVSHGIVEFDQDNASCYKRPSGCLIQTMPDARSKVVWLEHVEVDDKLNTHQMYRDLVFGRSGFGAKRWIITLERMCERMTLFSSLTIPPTDWSDVPTSGEGRKNVMKLGERMVKIFNEMLTMSGKVDFPQHSKCGVRISTRKNEEAGQPPGLVISAASSISIPLTPLQVFNDLQNTNTRKEWDVLSFDSVVTEISRILTGSSETNYVNIIRPTHMANINMVMPQDPDKNDMIIIQDCYMDALGGMLVYAPLDLSTIKFVASGEVDPATVAILPSGFIISSDSGRGTVDGGGGHEGGTLLTVALQILVTGPTSRSRDLHERSVATVSSLISSIAQKIKALLNYPHV